MSTRITPPEKPVVSEASAPTKLQLAGCGVLILVPIVLALAVPLYQRTDPTLIGIPFFYWWQMLMVVGAASACAFTYLFLFRNDPDEDYR